MAYKPDISRLANAMHKARWSLRHFREQRMKMVEQYVGAHWSEYADKQVVPVNLIAIYTQIVGRNLIAKNPRVMLSTFDHNAKPMVSAMEDWVNLQIPRMKLANTLQRVVLDSIFSIGIAKVALATPEDSAFGGWNLKAGEPFCERVDLDDFVFDVHARDFSEVSFIGHRYRAPLEVVKNDRRYSKARKDLEASTDPIFNPEGDERVSLLGRGTYNVDSEEFEDFVDLWEVYLPRHRMVLTLPDHYLAGPSGSGTRGSVEDALLEQKWLGPDRGPYHVLSLALVPGNAMPKAPLQDLIDMHHNYNNVHRKLDRQAERMKQNMLYTGTSSEDADRMTRANDGDALKCDNPERIQIREWGGPNQNLQLWANQIKELFSWSAGNLDIMGGLSPQSRTAHQDEMLNQNSTKTIADMQDRTIDFTSEVTRALLWYWHHHPSKPMRSHFTLPSMPEMGMVRHVHPEQRRALDFDDLNIEVDPYSMQHQTPQMRAQALTQTMTQIITPMIGVLAQQGMKIDLKVFLQKLSKYLDMPDLSEIVTIGEPPMEGQPGGAGSEEGASPASTTRNYVRRSLGQDSGPAKQETMAKQLRAAQPPVNGQMQGAGA